MQATASLFSGAIIGLTLAAPIGPMAILCINRTLNAGLAAGVSTGAGASTVHLMYGGVVLFGLKQARPWLESNRAGLSAFGAALMLFFAWRMLWRPAPAQASKVVRGRSMIENYASAIVFNGANPMLFILLISAMAAVVGTEPAGYGTMRLVLAGIFLGSFGWWIGLTGLTATVRGRLSQNALRAVNKVAALALLGFGLIALSRTFGG